MARFSAGEVVQLLAAGGAGGDDGAAFFLGGANRREEAVFTDFFRQIVMSVAEGASHAAATGLGCAHRKTGGLEDFLRCGGGEDGALMALGGRLPGSARVRRLETGQPGDSHRPMRAPGDRGLSRLCRQGPEDLGRQRGGERAGPGV